MTNNDLAAKKWDLTNKSIKTKRNEIIKKMAIREKKRAIGKNRVIKKGQLKNDNELKKRSREN